MKKKLLVLSMAFGLSLPLYNVFAGSCLSQCYAEYQQCLQQASKPQCLAEYRDCRNHC